MPILALSKAVTYLREGDWMLSHRKERSVVDTLIGSTVWVSSYSAMVRE